MESSSPGRAMVIVAHADDIEFVCAGTVAQWVRDGWQVTYVICTDSSRGSEDPDMSPQKLAELRIDEQRRAAAVIGVQDVVFLGHEDGTLADGAELRRQLVRLIRQRTPQRVITGDPTMRWSPGGYINHPDHIAVANAALASVYPFSRNRPTFPDLIAEGLEPHKVGEVWIWGGQPANAWVDIEDTIDLKVRALREHSSQMGDWDPEPMVRTWARRSGAGQLLEFAEAYHVIRLD